MEFNPLQFNFTADQADFWIAKYDQDPEAQEMFDIVIENAKEGTLDMMHSCPQKPEFVSYNWFNYFLQRITNAVQSQNFGQPMNMYAHYKILSDAPTYQKMVQDMVNEVFGNSNQNTAHVGYKLDPNLDSVLREQMIEGGVPEDEVQPSINDIEEAMDQRLKKSNLTDEDYASLSPEVNQAVVRIIREMRAAGASEEQIMAEVTDIVNQAAASNQEPLRSSMPDDHIIAAMTPDQLNAHLAGDPLQSAYYTLRLNADQLANIKGALRVFLNMIGESNPEAAKVLDALSALDTAEYDVAGSQSGLEDIPTLPE